MEILIWDSILAVAGIICLIICYKMTDSISITIIYGIYIGLIIFTFSLFALTTL